LPKVRIPIQCKSDVELIRFLEEYTDSESEED